MIMDAARRSAIVIMRSGALWRHQSHDHECQEEWGLVRAPPRRRLDRVHGTSLPSGTWAAGARRRFRPRKPREVGESRAALLPMVPLLAPAPYYHLSRRIVPRNQGWGLRDTV